MYTEEVNKIALSNNDDKRIQTFDGITTYQYGTNDFKVCKSEMLMVRFIFWKLQWNNVETINTCLKNTSCLQRIKMINFDN